MDICILCNSSKKDDIQYGEFLKNEHFGVHTFCLYLSSNLTQNGEDDEGFLGFLETDIKKEVLRISRLKCCYCNKSYANIGCCESKCRKAFHLVCGIEHKAENRFCKDFRSYCHKHARKVVQRPSPTETCLICFENICAPGEKFSSFAMILTPCCRNGWFHKLCLQKFAKTAGYFFKCPLCNDDKVFREKLPAKGIFIPNQDAAWELEPNAFAELLERPNQCSAKRCNNKKGRKAKSDSNPLIMCHSCGSIAIHKLCLSNTGRLFNCTDCSKSFQEHDSGRESLNSLVNQNDEYIDVCHVSDKEDLEIINRLGASSSKMTENKKRDSGMSAANVTDTESSCNEEMPQTTKKFRKLLKTNKENELNSDSESDNVLKPCSTKGITRLRYESESSESQPEIISRCSTTKYIIDLDSTSSDEQIYNNNIKSNETDNKTTKKTTIFSDSDSSETELENFNTYHVNAKNLKNEAKNSELINQIELTKFSDKKRKGSIISSDSEDEIFSAKHQRLSNENTVKRNISHRFFSLSDESDEDSDNSLESNPEIVEKQKSNCLTFCQPQKPQAKMETDNKKSDTEIKQTKNRSIDHNKTSKFVGEQNLATNKENNLDMSCIAKRTRRKTICSGSSTNTCKATEKQRQTENENLSNVSCIALRTRRKTVCGQTDFNKQSHSKTPQSSEYTNNSIIFEQLHESNENLDLTTDDEVCSEDESNFIDITDDTDLDFIVEDGYREMATNLEISCIANRTRKRKALRFQQLLPKIIEISDCSSDSSCVSLNLVSKNHNRRRCNNGRIVSTSSEEFERQTPSIQAEKTQSNSAKLEQFPAQNFTSVFTSNNKKTQSANSKNMFNYYPFNSPHPHSSNHYRV